MLRMSVGIDIAKDNFQSCLKIRYSDGRVVVLSNKSFANTASGFKALLLWTSRMTPKGYNTIKTVYVMEATGVYYERLSYFLFDKGLDVSVQLASNVKNFGKSLNIKTKTDKSDADVMAQMGIERQLEKWEAPIAVYRRLRQLTRERLALVEQKGVIKNQKHALEFTHSPNNQTVSRLDEHIAFMEEQISVIEKEIKQVVSSDESLQMKVKNVCTIKGVDTLTAVTVMGECNGFVLFKNKSQLVSYAGYDVVLEESGKITDKHGRISKKGNKFIRRALHYPALSCIQHDTSFKNLADRITDRTAVKMKGVVAVQRKLLVLIYKLFIDDTTYNPNHQEKHIKEPETGLMESHNQEKVFDCIGMESDSLFQ